MKGVAIVLIALALGIGGLLTGGAAVRIVREDTCRDANRAAVPQPDAECFAGSLNRRAGIGVLLVGSGLAAVVAMVAGFQTAFSRRRAGLFAALATVSIIFFALAFIGARV